MPIIAFLLVIFVDGEPHRPNDQIFFYDVNRCMYFAKAIRKQNYWNGVKYAQDGVGAHCLHQKINPKGVDIYR